MLNKLIVSTLVWFCFSGSGSAESILTGESEGMAYQVEQVASGLGVVWGLAFVGEKQLLITEREGHLKLLHTVTGAITPIQGGPEVWQKGQGGLLDVAVPHDFSKSDWIYLTYSKEVEGQGATTLARARLDGDRLVNLQDLLVTQSATKTGYHFGSRITFDEAGHVFFSLGDRGVRSNAQDRSNHAGSILRLRRDGSVPEDNPFSEKDGLPEIWCYGLRNPQGIFYDRGTGRLWSNDHGPRGGDEINLIEPGENYGWPVVSHGKEYWGPIAVGEATSKAGMKDPLKVFTPSIAPGSLLVYSGNAFPRWRGDFFSGALALVHLNRVVFDAEDNPVKEERLLTELKERIRNVIESPEGWLYLSTDSGKIFRIKPLSGESEAAQ